MTRPVLLVTGGSRGIGAATATLAAARGYDVCLTYRRNESEAATVCEAVTAAGGRSLAVQADIGEPAAIDALWRDVQETFGRVDVLVNNAGILATQLPLADMDAARLERLCRVNVVGTMLMCAAAVRHMSTARGGAGGVIVNLSSVAARTGSPGEYVDYAATKAAVDTLTLGLAREVAAEGIRVNAVRPGTINTDIHVDGGEPDRPARVARRIPLGRAGEPAEIAEAILWLASPQASYATGAILDVAGGL